MHRANKCGPLQVEMNGFVTRIFHTVYQNSAIRPNRLTDVFLSFISKLHNLYFIVRAGKSMFYRF